MPSILTSTKQIPSNGAYFLAKDTTGSGFNANFIYEPIQFPVGSDGIVQVNGTSVYFDTYANAVAFLAAATVPAPNTNYTLYDNELYRDMGKNISIYTQQTKSTGGYYYLHVATLTKVQRLAAEGQQTDGVVGGPIASNRTYYYTGYVCTWSSNPTASGIPVAVSRIGFQ